MTALIRENGMCHHCDDTGYIFSNDIKPCQWCEKGKEMRETKTETVSHQPQRWWVDYLHRVQSGRLVDTMTGKAVLSNSEGFHILDIADTKCSYVEACACAISKLTKAYQEIGDKMTRLMAEMAKQSNMVQP